jgi:murein DD-endopeptidase MepM/ murein hydrolase activator NlpD
VVASSAGFGLPAASADDVSTAQRRANAAANELSEAYTELADLDAEVARIENEHAAAEAELAGLRVIVNETAVRSYVHAGGADVPFLLGGDLNVEVRANALAQFVTMGSMDDIDRYRSMTADLETGAALLAQRKDAQAAAVERLRATKAAALKELARLQELKRKREQAEAARRARVAAAASRRGSSTAGTRSPVIRVPGNWACPVAGAYAFANDYGDRRSGGRSHKGNDIVAARGTPIVAPVAGFVAFRSVSLGGRSFFLQGVDGNEYFGTHLSGYAGGARSVSAGEVIGYVGDDGNASGIPHLHFEIHPGGGAAVNPYPTLSAYC